MNRSGTRGLLAGLMTLAACGLIAAGCGDDESTTTGSTSSGSSDASASIDQAVASCESTAQDLGSAAGAGLQAACTTVGENAKQALESGGEQAKEALAQAAASCKSTVSQLPDGEAQDALSDLCGAIAAD